MIFFRNEKQDQDLMVEKIKKEKTQLQENLKKCYEDIQLSELKNSQLNKVKSKLEHTLDELEDEVQKEKKLKVELEKRNRKVEADLRMSVELVSEKEKEKNMFNQTLSRKEKELLHMSAKLEDEQGLVIRYRNQIKECGGRIEELENELEDERQARAKYEKQKLSLTQEHEDLYEKLRDAASSSSAQKDVNKRKDSEIHRLKKILNEERLSQEDQLEAFKTKFNKTIADLSECLDKQIKSNKK